MSFVKINRNKKNNLFSNTQHIKAGLLVVLLAVIPFLLFVDLEDLFKHRNRLLSGNQTPSRIIQLKRIAPTQELITYEGMMNLRKQSIAENRDLLELEYQPNPAVFNRILPNLPWWSEAGFYLHGYKDSIEPGVPVEAQAIINPFLLIVPEFWSLTHWINQGNKIDPDKAQGVSPLPFAVFPENLEWDPSSRSATVRYNIRDFYNKASPLWISATPLLPFDFGISAYNARDFSLRHINLDLNASSNITNTNNPEDPVRLDDRLTASDTCKNLEKCNHKARFPSLFDQIRVEDLPAKAVFNLWHPRKRTAESTPRPPDFIYIIVIE